MANPYCVGSRDRTTLGRCHLICILWFSCRSSRNCQTPSFDRDRFEERREIGGKGGKSWNSFRDEKLVSRRFVPSLTSDLTRGVTPGYPVHNPERKKDADEEDDNGRLLPATVSVAFLLGTDPALFRATHQYTPPSCSFLPCITRRKNRDPVGSRTRCDLASPGDVCTSSPSLYHSITGSGLPSALQFNVTGSFFATIMSDGCSVIRGHFSCPEKQKRKR